MNRSFFLRQTSVWGMAIMVCVAEIVSAASVCEFENFQRATETHSGIKAKYQNSVFPLEVGPSRGTAYLVDSGLGYVMTAGHVIKDAISNEAMTITAHGPLLGQRGAVLTLLKYDLAENADFAILQFVDPTPVKDLVALDISSRLPGVLEKFTTLSWGEDPSEAEPQAGAPEFSRTLRSGMMEFSEQSTGVDRGDSGSPLIDSTGLVIGTLKRRMSVVKTHYVSMRLARAAVVALDAGASIRTLDIQVRSGSETQQSLLPQLSPVRGDLSNFGLTTWVGLILKSKTQYKQNAHLFPCPILPAFFGRDIGRFAMEISGFASTPIADRARRLMNEAQDDALVADLVNARKAFQAASELLSESIDVYESTYPSSKERANCWIQNESAVECATLSGDAVLAGLYRDQSLAHYGAAGVVEFDRTHALAEARSSIEMAVLLTDKSWSLGISYSILGDVLLKLDDPVSATGAYAAAYDEGTRYTWLSDNFEQAAESVGDEELARRLRVDGIENTRRTMPQDVYRPGVALPRAD